MVNMKDAIPWKMKHGMIENILLEKSAGIIRFHQSKSFEISEMTTRRLKNTSEQTFSKKYPRSHLIGCIH